mmetsp:Transcript_2237/g.6526  ORF Transcript_2237/g.6526 Transcript_2237/m.6526 type:complete len:93 (-) Transcript_2237:420-698(-)
MQPHAPLSPTSTSRSSTIASAEKMMAHHNVDEDSIHLTPFVACYSSPPPTFVAQHCQQDTKVSIWWPTCLQWSSAAHILDDSLEGWYDEENE